MVASLQPMREVWPYHVSNFAGVKWCDSRPLSDNPFRTDSLRRSRSMTSFTAVGAAVTATGKQRNMSSARATEEESDPLVFGVPLSTIKKNCRTPGTQDDKDFRYMLHSMPGYVGHVPRGATTSWCL
eukprot:TRINITY_DN13050_c0_g3_i1.p1 TRINITY_DN13050_c0_g3~~TRINITY_DN13050_c0_g3_i1.p1  ORF type:complete len:147 (-),score=9.81 TRINITY_DN13050_c0_g3_i1:262-642(-)